jgi:hypothetical protein
MSGFSNVACPRRLAAQALAPRGKNASECAKCEGAQAGTGRTVLAVREILFRARSQMVRYHASAAIFTGLGMQH